MEVIAFETGWGTCAIPFGEIDRILPAGVEAPPGYACADIADLLDRPRAEHVRGTGPGCLALLRGTLALRCGEPLGAVAIEATWIIPLPGFMFRMNAVPFRGIIEVPEAASKGRARHVQRALLLDAGDLCARAAATRP